MKIVIFSDRNIKKIFQQLEKSSQYSVFFSESKKLTQLIKKENEVCLYYLDVEALSERQIASILKSNTNPKINFGLIDQKQQIADPALYFRLGVSDYLGQRLCKEPIPAKRLESIIPIRDGGQKKAKTTKKAMAVSSASIEKAIDWKNIQSGNEYLFTMMFIELDGSRNLGHRVREATVDRLLKNFQKTVEAYVATQKGKIWIWSDFGGIVLFPYSKNITNIAATCMRLMFSRRIISVDQSEQKLLLSYRIVLFSGSTIYRERGKTGRIISDAVNSLAHIGQKYAQPGNMYVVKNMIQTSLPEIQACFKDSGSFEGTELLKMKLPQPY